MVYEHANDANARLRKVFPKGFALDTIHNPHITILQRYVQTTDLDKVYAAVGNVLASEKVINWKLKAFKYYYIPVGEIGVAGTIVESTDDLHRLQPKTNRRSSTVHGKNRKRPGIIFN